jgi:hypothetical protein
MPENPLLVVRKNKRKEPIETCSILYVIINNNTETWAEA